MKIVIFGASGFIGNAVTKALVAQGHDVTGIVRSKAGAILVCRAGATPLIGDMTRPKTWADAVSQADGAIQLAASFDGDLGAAEREWLDPLLELVRKRHPIRLIYTGGCWLYPEQTEPSISEETPFNPFAPFAYMVDHRARIAQSENIHLTTIHPGIVWSETGGFYAQYRAQIEAGLPISVVGSSETLWPLVHVDDLAALYALAITQSATAPDYLGVVDVGLPIRGLIQRVSYDVKNPARIKSVSVAQAVLEKGEWAAGLTRSQRIVSDKARKDLDWQPTRSFVGKTEMIVRRRRLSGGKALVFWN